MPCSTYARQTGAVPSGRSVSERPAASVKVNISLRTMSVDSRQVDASDAALEEDVTGEQRAGDRVGDVAGAVSRRESHVDLETGELEVLIAGDGVLGLIALERAEPGRHPAHHVGQHGALD